jgi:hypothetical protein
MTSSANVNAHTVGGDPIPGNRIEPLAGLDSLRFAPTSRVVRRSAQEIQIERGDRAVIVSNLPSFVVATLRRQGGRVPLPGTGADVGRDANLASGSGGSTGSDLEPDEFEIGRVLRSLTHAGYLVHDVDDPPVAGSGARSAALEPDLAALDERFGSRARSVLDDRFTRSVRVHGTGRLASSIAAILAASGIGQVQVPDSADVRLGDVLPGGLRPGDEGDRTALAAAEAVRRARAGSERVAPRGEPADLVLCTDGYPVDPTLRRDLELEPRPLLVCGVWSSRGVIGPLVVPGRTSCLRCADLHRSDRDPAWPVLSAQLAGPRHTPTPSEVAVCTLTAAITAIQALAFLDGERPATADGTLEIALPDWRVRRRHWPRHGDCACAR